jgi:predicted  nucleic acid-binding Zn-ribbon protein
MNSDDLKTYTTVALALWNVGLTIAMWLRKPGEDAGAAVDALRTEHGNQLAKVVQRLVGIETDMRHMPTSEELAQLEGTVKQIAERTEAMTDNMSTVRTQLNRIENYLLDKK